MATNLDFLSTSIDTTNIKPGPILTVRLPENTNPTLVEGTVIFSTSQVGTYIDFQLSHDYFTKGCVWTLVGPDGSEDVLNEQNFSGPGLFETVPGATYSLRFKGALADPVALPEEEFTFSVICLAPNTTFYAGSVLRSSQEPT